MMGELPADLDGRAKFRGEQTHSRLDVPNEVIDLNGLTHISAALDESAQHPAMYGVHAPVVRVPGDRGQGIELQLQYTGDIVRARSHSSTYGWNDAAHRHFTTLPAPLTPHDGAGDGLRPSDHHWFDRGPGQYFVHDCTEQREELRAALEATTASSIDAPNATSDCNVRRAILLRSEAGERAGVLFLCDDPQRGSLDGMPITLSSDLTPVLKSLEPRCVWRPRNGTDGCS